MSLQRTRGKIRGSCRTDNKDCGIALVATTLAMLVILVCVGLAVDGFRLFNYKISQQEEAEFVAISVLRSYKATNDISSAISLANSSGNSNAHIAIAPCGVATDVCVEFGIWSPGGFSSGGAPSNAVRITYGTATGVIRPLFLQLIGLQEMTAASVAMAFYDSSLAPTTPGQITAYSNPYVIVREAGQ